MTAKYIVFVDFDGVLTSNRLHITQPKDSYEMWSSIDPNVMQFFNYLHNTYDGVRFVWTTSWRNNGGSGILDEHIAYSLWYSVGFRGLLNRPFKVNEDNDSSLYAHRAVEIKNYLDQHGKGYKDFMIIDDSDYRYNEILGVRRFIKTDVNDGMLFEHFKNALALVGTWDKR